VKSSSIRVVDQPTHVDLEGAGTGVILPVPSHPSVLKIDIQSDNEPILNVLYYSEVQIAV
jgi:hypothetical protein